MKQILASIGVVAFVSGCAGGGIGLPGSSAWLKTSSPEAIASYYSKRCVTYGIKPGTPDMGRCIQSEVQNERSSNAMKASGRFSTYCQNYGSSTVCF